MTPGPPVVGDQCVTRARCQSTTANLRAVGGREGGEMMDSAGRAIRSLLIGDAGKTLLERTMGFVVMTAGAFALGDYFLPLSIVSGDE